MFWLNFAFFVVIMILEVRILLNLRSMDPALYDDFGGPNLWFPNVAAFNFWLDFIMFGQYEDRLHDSDLKRQCTIVRILTLIWLGLDFVFVAVGVALYLTR